MTSFEIHIKKYRLFKKDAENETVSHPTRITSYFEAAFHLIEAVVAKHDEHINKHQKVRSFLEQKKDIFKEDTELVWRKFQLLENQIRPGQAYGGKINGEELKRAKKAFEEIRKICNRVLQEWSKKNSKK